MTWLIGAATLLARTRDAWRRTLMPVGSSGVLSSRAGVGTSAGDSLQIRMFGRGAHGSMPQASLGPVIMAAAAVLNDPEVTKRVGDAFRLCFPADRVQETGPTTASEDFGCFGAGWGVPSVFWFVGGTDSNINPKARKKGKTGDVPTNHNPRLAPAIHPPLETGVEALVVAAQAWLSA